MNDAKVSSTSRPNTTALLHVTVGVTVAILVAGTAIMSTPRSAAAKPEFAAQTGRACGACHQNAAGGGKLKPFGEAFKANGFKLPKK